MKKKGQASIFIILGLVLLIALWLIYYTSSVKIETIQQEIPKKVLPTQIEPVNSFVKSCLEETGREAVRVIGIQGGYYFVPEPSVKDDPFNNFDLFDYPYYLYLGQKNIPKMEMIEAQISSYVNVQLDSCINDFSTFKQQDYEIVYGKSKTTTKISEDSVNLNMNYQIAIKKDDIITSLSDFDAKINSRLIEILDASDKIVEQQIDSPDLICLSCIVEIANQKNLEIEMYPHEDNAVLFVIQDYEVRLNEEPYEFIFAVKFPER